MSQSGLQKRCKKAKIAKAYEFKTYASQYVYNVLGTPGLPREPQHSWEGSQDGSRKPPRTVTTKSKNFWNRWTTENNAQNGRKGSPEIVQKLAQQMVQKIIRLLQRNNPKTEPDSV